MPLIAPDLKECLIHTHQAAHEGYAELEQVILGDSPLWRKAPPQAAKAANADSKLILNTPGNSPASSFYGNAPPPQLGLRPRGAPAVQNVEVGEISSSVFRKMDD